MSIEQIDKIIDKYVDQKGILIKLLIDIQQELNWIPKEAIMRINKRLNIPVSEIYRVASFYTALSLTPRGKHLVRVCSGTACYVRGGSTILDSVEHTLGIKNKETSADGKYTIETVNCLGCCALGPVIELDGKYYGVPTPAKAKELLSHVS